MEERTRGASRNLTWTPAMSEFILKYLAKVVRAGQRSQKGFKVSTLSEAAEAASDKFGKKVMYCHVQNHLKTVKKRWRRVEIVKSMDGAAFYPDTNIVEMQYEAYNRHVEAHPGDEQYINKPIKNYEEMRLVCGNDDAFDVDANSSKEPWNSSDDVNLVDQTNGDDDDDYQYTSNYRTCKLKRRRKARQSEMEFEDRPGERRLRNARWSPAMSNFLLTYLTGEAKAGHKGLTGFKLIALNNAAEAVSKKFGNTMTSCHVQNHLKTLKKYWTSIERIRKTSGVVLNSDTNTLQMGLEEYMKYIEAHPGDDKFINRPIKYYAELEIVCGNDYLLEGGTSKGAYDPCEASSDDANLDCDDIGVDQDVVAVLTNLDVDYDDGDNDDDVDGNGNGDSDSDYETTYSRSRKRKKLGQAEEYIVTNVKRAASSKQSQNMRWNSELTEFLLNYLVEETRRGNKGPTGFKASVITKVMNAINKKFRKKMMFSNVQNHLKTVRRWWKRIQLIKSLSGVTFHPDANTLEMEHEDYQKHVQAHPGDDLFINKPIKMFSQMEIIFTNDSKAFIISGEVDLAANESPDVNLCTNEEDINYQDEPQPVTPVAIDLGEANLAANDEAEQQSGTSSWSRKRKRPDQTQENLTNFVGHMAVALKELSTDKTVRFAKDIMAELRTIQSDFSSRALRKAQRFLVENSLDGACFISYNRNEKVAWMKDFVDEHLGGNGN